MPSIPLDPANQLPDPLSEDDQLEGYIRELERIIGERAFWTETAKKLSPAHRRMLRDRIIFCINGLNEAVRDLG